MVITNLYISIDQLEYNDVLGTLHTHTRERRNEEKRDKTRERGSNSIPFPI
jgi:hypothetical protein